MALFFGCTVVGGILLGLQGLVNASLGMRIGVMPGTLVNHLVGTLCAGALLLGGLHTGHLHFQGVPISYFLGGAIGVVALCGNNYAIPRVGASVMILLLTIAQLASAAVVDAAGLFGATVSPFRWQQLVGLLLLMGGAACVALDAPRATRDAANANL